MKSKPIVETMSIDEDHTISIATLDNDTDPDGDRLTTFLLVEAANGTVTLTSNGQLTYTPDADFFGTETVSYPITDGFGATDTAVVTITVAPVNDAPTQSMTT